jgi:signal transduction histidine kinase
MKRNLKILHLEDDVHDAELVQSALEKAGLMPEVTLAKSHSEFLAALGAAEYDVILSDNQVLGCSGIEAVQLARAKSPTIPFIFVSGVGDDPERRKELIQTGAADVLSKSDLHKLHDAILEALDHVRGEGAVKPSKNIAGSMERFVAIVQELSLARDLERIMSVVRQAARELTGADGATFVLREGDMCHYADEEAIAPLWKGRRFPMSACISGWVTANRQPAVIEDIYADPRILADVYRSTFVKSLVMVPIRASDPVGAIGNYWAAQHRAGAEEIRLLQALADSTSVALQNVHLYAGLEQEAANRAAHLQMLNEELEAFSYTVSHDLRAPLRHIDGYVGLLRAEAGPSLSAASHRRLDVIAESARRVGTLIDDLLELSRMSRSELRRGPVDVHQLIEEIRSELGREIAGREIRWEIGDLPIVDGDRAMLKQVWFNLLSNAVKFTRQRDRAVIAIRATVRTGETEFTVRDNGTGFDMRLAHNLFRVFQRLHQEDEFEGTGVGLANVRRIVGRHGGRTWAEGEVNRGASFHFTLPAVES